MEDRVAIYCRLSKEDGELEAGGVSESIKNQKLLLTDYANAQGWVIHYIYCDEDLKGFDRDRPDFKRLIKDAEQGAFNIILCKHQSRFTRDMELVEKYINGRFILWGIRFVSIIDNVDTFVKGNKKARQIHGLVNEWYSEDLSENIRCTFRKKMEDGQFLGSFAPYGYAKDPMDRHKIIIDAEAATVVREIYALYTGGLGVSRIAQTLTERGILTPVNYKKKSRPNYAHPKHTFSGENIWAVSTVKRILCNEVYIGTLIQGRERKVSYKSKKCVIAPRDEWVIIKNNHPAIIDQKTFNTVQKLRKSRRRESQKNGVHVNRPNIFAGKIKCAECGASLQRSGFSDHSATYYYRCRVSAATKRGKCTPHSIGQSTIEDAVLKRIQFLVDGYLLSNDNSNGVLKDITGQLQQRQNNNFSIKKEIEELDQNIKDKDILIAKTFGEKINGNISEDEFRAYKTVFENEKAALEKRKNYLTGLSLAKQPQKHMNFDALFQKHKKISRLDYHIVNDFIDTVEISEDRQTKQKQIIINWNF